jgi:hypothetical protein
MSMPELWHLLSMSPALAMAKWKYWCQEDGELIYVLRRHSAMAVK